MGIKVLLIDDEADITELTGRYLALNGFEVETSNDSAEAIERAEKKRFDAVVVDLMMFPVGGLAVLRKLRELPDYAGAPLFVLSAKELEDVERRELLAMKVQFIAKPVHPRVLAEKLREQARSA